MNPSIIDKIVLKSWQMHDSDPSFLDVRDKMIVSANSLGYSQYVDDIRDNFALHLIPNLHNIAKPENFVCTNSTSVGSNPHFQWDSHPEADYFLLYRRNATYGTAWESPITVTGNEYTDTEVWIYPLGDENDYVYRLHAHSSTYGTSDSTAHVHVIGQQFEKNAGEFTKSIPKEFGLSANYPNPFNPVTTIKYQLPKASHVALKIYNILGQEVAKLVHTNMPAGFHSVKWDAFKAASGTYIYRITAGDFTAVKKMVVIK